MILLFFVTNRADAQGVDDLSTARWLLAESRPLEAISLLERSDSVQSVAQAYLLGLGYQALNRHDRALAWFARADSSDRTVQKAIGRSLVEMGLTEAALAQYEKVYRADTTDATALAGLARLYMDTRLWEKARRAYLDLITRDSTDSYALARLGRVYHAIDSTDAAIVALERAHRMNTANVQVSLQLSSVYLGADRTVSARRVIDRSLERVPGSASLWSRSGEIAFKEEAYDEAVKHFSNAFYAGDSTAATRRNLGASYFMTRGYESAFKWLDQSWESDTTDGMTAFYLGLTYDQLSMPDSALIYLDRATENLGQDMLAHIHAQKANVFDKTGQEDNAVDSYRLSLSLNADKPEVLFQLAAVYDHSSTRRFMAIRQYQEFLNHAKKDELTELQDMARRRIAELIRKREPEPAIEIGGVEIQVEELQADSSKTDSIHVD